MDDLDRVHDDAARRGEPDAEFDAELDGVRIRQLSTLRRATYRSRSYAMIWSTVCAVATVQFIIMAAREDRPMLLIAWVLLAICSSWMSFHCARRAIALHREAKRKMLVEPTTPPDFSTLSDGSQHARNLEDVR
jgi:hypothetical protein